MWVLGKDELQFCCWTRAMALSRLLALSACSLVVGAPPPPIPITFGNGIAGFNICESPTVVLNHSLSSNSSYALLTHFWTTGGSLIDNVIVE